jgi:hypothetical protein
MASFYHFGMLNQEKSGNPGLQMFDDVAGIDWIILVKVKI